jgi:hypothetical protein
MGGMSFEDSAEEDQKFMPENRRRLNITLKYFEFMVKMRDHLIPDISREHIQDKNKSDRLAKLLTCWQAGYFCTQCVFRLSQELSVTLLELNVFAHALCALSLFAIWTDKPRDVSEPTLITGEEAMDICALLCVHIVGGDDKKYFEGYVDQRHADPDKALEIINPTSFSCSIRRYEPLCYGALHDSFTLKVLETHWILLPSRKSCEAEPFVTFVTFGVRDFRWLQRVSRLLQHETSQPLGPTSIRFSNLPLSWSRGSMGRTSDWMMNNSSGSLAFYSVKDGHFILHFFFRCVWFSAGITFAGVCYGGLHLVAWNKPFASDAQALLWRTASVSITTTGPIFPLAVVCANLLKHFDFVVRRLSSRIYNSIIYKKTLKPILEAFFTDIFPNSLILWYIFYRTFIIIESFIMLAHIPDEALQVPTWSAYIPHIV